VILQFIVVDGCAPAIVMAVLYYRPKTGFWEPFSQMLSDLDEI